MLLRAMIEPEIAFFVHRAVDQPFGVAPTDVSK